MVWSPLGMNVLAFARLTSLLELVIKLYTTRREKLNYMTSQQYQMSLFEDSEVWTLSVEDFRAKLSALRELDEDSKILEELSSLKSQGSPLFSNLSIYSLKMSKDSSTTTKEIPLRQSSQRWMNSGMMWNGKCLTAKISEYRKIGNVCSLSDILEENVDGKFFLSEEMVQRLIVNNQWSQGSFTVTNRDSVKMEDLLDGEILDVTIIGNIHENKDILEV